MKQVQRILKINVLPNLTITWAVLIFLYICTTVGDVVYLSGCTYFINGTDPKRVTWIAMMDTDDVAFNLLQTRHNFLYLFDVHKVCIRLYADLKWLACTAVNKHVAWYMLLLQQRSSQAII